MIGQPLNILDASVLTILALSALVAFFRGFVREILSLVAWVGAAMITLYLYPHTLEFLKHHMSTKNEHILGAISMIGTYMVALIAISMMNAILIRYLKTGMEVGILDNFLGLIFGAMRGVFIVSLGYLLITYIVPKDNPPEWIKTSFTKDYLEKGADVLVKVTPEYVKEIEGFVKKEEAEHEKEPNSDQVDYNSDGQKAFHKMMDATQSGFKQR
jgi:membrane protein required for colicin V production